MTHHLQDTCINSRSFIERMILMKLNPQTFARESSLVMGAVYVVCAAFVALFPEFSTKLLGWFPRLKPRTYPARGEHDMGRVYRGAWTNVSVRVRFRGTFRMVV